MTARKKKTGDTDPRKAVLAAALPHVVFDGFTDRLLSAAGKEAGVDKATMARLFPEGALSLVEAFSQSADADMEKAIAALDLKNMKVRVRITAAVQARLAALRPHKEAARRAAAFLSLPPHAAVGAKLVYRTVDAMWRAIGDTSTDFNFYTKRGILAAVYSSTLLRWFSDTSADESVTEHFLADRIENVMQFEKIKARAKQTLDQLPPLADIIGAFNARRG